MRVAESEVELLRQGRARLVHPRLAVVVQPLHPLNQPRAGRASVVKPLLLVGLAAVAAVASRLVVVARTHPTRRRTAARVAPRCCVVVVASNLGVRLRVDGQRPGVRARLPRA